MKVMKALCDARDWLMLLIVGAVVGGGVAAGAGLIWLAFGRVVNKPVWLACGAATGLVFAAVFGVVVVVLFARDAKRESSR